MDEITAPPSRRELEANQRLSDALHEAFAPAKAAGHTHKALAEYAHVSPPTVSRYFKGTRIADKKFIDALIDFLDSHGLPVTAHGQFALHQLRRTAEAASTSRGLKVRSLEEQLTDCQDALDLCTADRTHFFKALSAAETQVLALRHLLTEQAERATAAEIERDALQHRGHLLQRQLTCVTGRLQAAVADVEHEQNTALHLEQENFQLRCHVARLTDELDRRAPALPRPLTATALPAGPRCSDSTFSISVVVVCIAAAAVLAAPALGGARGGTAGAIDALDRTILTVFYALHWYQGASPRHASGSQAARAARQLAGLVGVAAIWIGAGHPSGSISWVAPVTATAALALMGGHYALNGSGYAYASGAVTSITHGWPRMRLTR